MYDAVECFLIERTGRRVKRGTYDCPNGHEHVLREDELGPGVEAEDWSYGDLTWPDRCPTCGEALEMDADGSPSSSFIVTSHEFRRPDTGQVGNLSSFGPGAMWDDEFGPKGPDGRSMTVVLPNRHTWHIDSEASNCTRKGEPHQCWVRHGEPPKLHVDKQGDTCAAGGGSIVAGDYHGHLHHGVLTAG